MKILDSKLRNFNKKLDNLLLRRKTKVQTSSVSVIKIINDVKKNGDKALLKYEKKFNQNRVIKPSLSQIKQSIKSLDPKVKNAIDLAYSRIYKFHSLQKFKNISYIDKLKNKLEYKYLPIESVAIYVPGSSASYPSSVLMNAIPAIVAGVKRIIMINPGYKGKQNAAVLYAAKKCKIKEIYSIGGPSAIAAVSAVAALPAASAVSASPPASEVPTVSAVSISSFCSFSSCSAPPSTPKASSAAKVEASAPRAAPTSKRAAEAQGVWMGQ